MRSVNGLDTLILASNVVTTINYSSRKDVDDVFTFSICMWASSHSSIFIRSNYMHLKILVVGIFLL